MVKLHAGGHSDRGTLSHIIPVLGHWHLVRMGDSQSYYTGTGILESGPYGGLSVLLYRYWDTSIWSVWGTLSHIIPVLGH